MNKTILATVAATLAIAASASSTVTMHRVLGSVSRNAVRIAYTIANDDGCEQLAVTIWADESRSQALYEKFLDDAGKYATTGKHTVTFSLDSSEYSLAQIKSLFPNAIVEVYADFCGIDSDDYDPSEDTEDAMKLVYSSSQSSALDVPEKVQELYSKAKSWTTILSSYGESEIDTFDAYGLVKVAVSRHNSKGQVKVKMAVKSFFGPQASGSTIVKPYEDGTLYAKIELVGFGTFTIIGSETNGSYDIYGYESSGTYSFENIGIGGSLQDETIYLDFDPADLPVLSNKDVIEEALPVDYAIGVSNGSTLACGSIPKLGFAAASSASDTSLPTYGDGWVLTGVNDASKPNASSLRLKYSPTSGVFQGKFKVYYTNANYTSEKPRAKGATVTVRGAMTANGVGVGMAGMKISDVKYFFPVTLWGDVSK